MTLRRFLVLPWLCAALAGAGCVTLPDANPKTPSRAIADDGTTALGRLAAASRAASAPLPSDSGFRLLPTAGYALDVRRELLRRAERSIDLQYYVLTPDVTGRRVLRDLAEAARRGVRVRLLIDDLYSVGAEDYLTGLASFPNVEVRLFNPLPVRGRSVLGRLLWSRHEFLRINHRMHNKLLVADGAFAVVGGRNIADEYFMSARPANFVDLDTIAAGPVVAGLAAGFDAYWNSAYVWPVGNLLKGREPPEAAQRAFETATEGDGPNLVFMARDPLRETAPATQFAAGRIDLHWAPARVVYDSPTKVDDDVPTQSAVMRDTLQLIGAARSEVLLVSPYLVPGEVGMPMMRAATGAGVQTIIFTNGIGSTDVPLVYAGYSRYRKEMLKLGVVIYELSPTSMRESGDFGDFAESLASLHAKVAVVDRRWLFIGSMNLDGRSAITNTELGVIVDSPFLAEQTARLIRLDDYRSMYRLRLGEDGDSIEWVSTDRQGRETVSTSDPGGSWLTRLKLWLLSPFVPEAML